MTPPPLRLAFALGAALAVVAGCDPTARPADTVDAGASPRAQACAHLAAETCARLTACAPEFTRLELGVGAVCEAAVRDDCLRRAGLGGSRRTTSVVDACAAEVAGLSCSALLERFPEPCPPPLGLLAAGTACAFHEQCATGFCGREDDAACGACVSPPGVGAACVGDECGPGLVCTSAHRCARPVATGGSCGPNAPCNRFAFCDFDTCKPRRALGEACAGLGECDPYDGAFCSVTLHCARARVAADGAACSLSANELTLCTPPARCVDGRCEAPRLEGAACGTSGAHACAGFPPECIQGRCLVRTVETCGGTAQK